MDWSTLYVAGRMHKPVRIIRPDARILLANQINLVSALRVALLMLPEEFTEVELWEQIAGISYAGEYFIDPCYANDKADIGWLDR